MTKSEILLQTLGQIDTTIADGRESLEIAIDSVGDTITADDAREILDVFLAKLSDLTEEARREIPAPPAPIMPGSDPHTLIYEAKSAVNCISRLAGERDSMLSDVSGWGLCALLSLVTDRLSGALLMMGGDPDIF